MSASRRSAKDQKTLPPLLLHTIAYFSYRGLPFLAMMVTARVLNANEFGHLASAFSLFASLQLFVELGLGTATIKRVAEANARRDGHVLVTLSIAVAICAIFSIVGGAAMLSHSRWLADLLFVDPSMHAFIIVGVVYIPAAALASIATSALQGLQLYRELAWIGCASGFPNAVLVVLLANFGGGLAAAWGVVIGLALRAVLACGLIVRLTRPTRDVFSITKLLTETRILASIALPASLTAAAWAPVNAYLVTTLLNSHAGAAEAGAFGLGLQLFSLTLIIPGILTQFALPKLSGIYGVKAHAAHLRVTILYSASATAAVITLCAPLIMLPNMIGYLFGESFHDYNDVLILMMVASGLSAPQGVISNYMLARGMHWHRLWTKYMWGAAVILTMLLVGQYSAKGAAFAYVIGWSVLLICQMILVIRDQMACRYASTHPRSSDAVL